MIIAADIRPATTAWRAFTRRFRNSRSGVVSFSFLFVVILVAVAAPMIAPADPLDQDLSATLRGPTASHLLGTDQLGRDILSRLIFGARISLTAAAIVVSVALIVGVVPGLIAGYLGGWFDRVVTLLTDAIMSIPPLILALGVVGVLGPGLVNTMVPVGIVFAPRFLRVVRSAVLGVRQETYIEAARSIGTPTSKIISRHVLPNVMSPIIVQASLTAAYAMLAEAGLSYLGLGVQAPQASWGSMIGSSSRLLSRKPILIVWPGLCVTITVLAFSLLGDALRDSLGRELRTVKD
jgi:peptide/nickel transport system permease protein